MSASASRLPWRRAVVFALACATGAAGLLLPSSVAAQPRVPQAIDALAPDILDVDFDGVGANDRAQGLTATTWGAPVFSEDAEVARSVMTTDGQDDAVSFPFEQQWPKLTGGLSVECVFKINQELPLPAEMDLCSDKEAGGFSMYATGSTLGVMGHIGGGYKRTMVPISSGRWYHSVSTWDGEQIRLYVNGALAASVAASGALLPPTASAQRFVVGADASPTGIGQVGPAGNYAAAGVFSRALNEAEVAALAAEWNTAIPTPTADVVDIDFADQTPAETANNLPATTHGSPSIAVDPVLQRPVATVNGSTDAYSYPFGEQWPKLANSFSIECSFRYTGDFPAAAERDVCSSKESGGFAVYVTGNQVGLMAHIGGAYRNVRSEIAGNQWYHVVGVWTGTQLQLWVNGVLVNSLDSAGVLGIPANATAHNWVLGADASTNGRTQFYAQAKIATSRIYTKALAADEIDALRIESLGEFPKTDVALRASTPAQGAEMVEPGEFTVDIANADNASGWTYRLDDDAIQPGQEIGAGLSAGDHVITISATDVLGAPIRWEIPFTSTAIPSGGGTDTSSGRGRVTLSAIASSPDGSDVTTTFRQATASVAQTGFAGTVNAIPASLDFDYQNSQPINDAQKIEDGKVSKSPTSSDVPFQRFDVSVGGSVNGQRALWSGVVDPERSVELLVWNTVTKTWEQIGSARGSSVGETELNGKLQEAHVDGGTVHLMVVGIDPFADDLAPRDETAKNNKDQFENVNDYDFSFAHFTDTQYIAEGAVGGTYNDWDGVEEPSDIQQKEEQAVWAAAYKANTDWIRDNAKLRKIVYTAHTGDVIENDYYDPLATDAAGNVLYPGLDEQVTKEFTFTSGEHNTLDSAGVVNQVIAGNHDNQMGAETGPTSRFNNYFGPNRYYQAAAAWPEGASYHAWDETTDAAGNVIAQGSDNQNSYVLFSAGGLDFVAVGLSFGVTQEEADWADSIFKRFPDRNGILISHAYLAPSASPDGRGANFSADGSKLFDEVVEANPNVFLILAGHEHGVGTNLKSGVGATVSHNVVELLADYQFYKVSAKELWPDLIDPAGNIDLNGDGVVDHLGTDLLQFGASWLRLLQFDVDRAEVSIDTYSPKFDNFGATEYDDRARYNGAEDNLVLPVDLSSRTTTFSTDGVTVITPTTTVIGEDTARSGWPASVEWKQLKRGQVYAWVADSRTINGDRVGTISQFGSAFLVGAKGSDMVPPTINLPSTNKVTVGDRFDPLEGVTVSDDVDGDISDRVQVIGRVDTDNPGTYPLTYLAVDSVGNQVVVARAIEVAEVVDLRAKAVVKVGNFTGRFGQAHLLSASVDNANATGSVQFLSGEDTLCSAPLLDGEAQCEVATLPPPGDYVLTTIYSGDGAYLPGQSTSVLTVLERKRVSAKISGKAKVKRVPAGKKARLVASLPADATGQVTFRAKGPSKKTCKATIKNGRATCTVAAKIKPGKYQVRVSYRGDAGYRATNARFTFRKLG